MKKPYLIVTSSDKKYGDFLIEHWLTSLKENVNLSKIDILILDYGLSKAQRFYLKNDGVLLKECVKDNHVANIRFRDLLSFLKENNNYEQILSCDGGDIIFQDDISFLFEEHKDSFRAVCEKITSPFEYFITTEYFFKSDIKPLKEILIVNKTINAGFFLAPYDKMVMLCQKVVDMVKNKSKFGPDQIVVNYVMYKTGFVELDTKYNFIPATNNEEFYIKDGVFYDANGKKIPVVHNAGNIRFFRSIENFGYGKGFNILKTDILNTLRALYTSLSIINKPRTEIVKATKKLESLFNSMFEENRTNYKMQKIMLKKALRNIKKLKPKL
ncbi:MAG: glycosyl transferase family 8 [Brevinematia bacterium]